MFVIPDSPLFSTLVAKHAPQELKGTGLTMVNCIGFSITILSIQLFSFLLKSYDSIYINWVLAIGPMIGLVSLLSKAKSRI